MDKRKRPIRDLWERNGRYYAQLTVEDQVTDFKQVKRVPMEGVSTDAQAVAKLEELLAQRRKIPLFSGEVWIIEMISGIYRSGCFQCGKAGRFFRGLRIGIW